MTMPFPSPTVPAAGRAEVFVRYLDYFRAVVVAKVSALPVPALRTSRLTSGWTPLELVKHLRFVEMRWIEWGFLGRPADEPWGDERDDEWFVEKSESREELLAALRAQGDVTDAVATSTDLATVGKPGPRFEDADPPTLERILFHLLQEYARHAGHLDIVAELWDGPLGE